MSAPRHFYNLRDLTQGARRALAEGIETRIFVGEKAMLSVVTLEPYAVGTIHSHPEEQWGVVIAGGGVRIQDDRHIPVQEGDFWLTPGNIFHGFRAGERGALILDIFSPPREEYRSGAHSQ